MTEGQGESSIAPLFQSGAIITKTNVRKFDTMAYDMTSE